MATVIDNPEKLHKELQAAGFPVVGVSSDGRIDYSRELTKSEKTALAASIASFDPAPTKEESRLEAYKAKGITPELLIWALWDQVIKADSTKAIAIEKLMTEIDLKIN
jgi:hypothetical protein